MKEISSIADIIVGLTFAGDSLMNLRLGPDQRESIDMIGIINLLDVAANRLGKLYKYRKKYKRFKRKYIELRGAVRINDTINRHDVMTAIKEWHFMDTAPEHQDDINIEKLYDRIKEINNSPIRRKE